MILGGGTSASAAGSALAALGRLLGPSLTFWLGYEGEAREEMYAREHFVVRMIGPGADWVAEHGYQYGLARRLVRDRQPRRSGAGGEAEVLRLALAELVVDLLD